MKIIKLNTWEELEDNVNNLKLFLKSKKSSDSDYVSVPIYRGQSSSEWKLETTLERYINDKVSVNQYDHYLGFIKPAIESYTQEKWILEKDSKIDIDNVFFHTLKNYEFMAYVRHHGFPSPLLDWTQSLCVALFFAFHKVLPGDRAAIYTYVEYLGTGKSGCGGEPIIQELGPYISTDKRHFMQQGCYAISVKNHNGAWTYCSHEDCFSDENNKNDQDCLIKYTLPGSIKNEVLTKLQSMNINAFTLFGSEDSLMDMLAFKEIIGRKIVKI